MKYCRIFLYVLLLLMDIVPAVANVSTPKESFIRINQCVQNEDDVSCRELFTASSLGLYDRFTSYDLTKCLPKDTAFTMQQRVTDSQVIIYATVTFNNMDRAIRLVFTKESGIWKLDAPESLHLALGDNWEQKVDKAEQVYLLVWQQFGPQLNCDMLQNLRNKYHHKK